MDALGRPLGFEQRESAKVLVLVRWAVLGALLLLVDYPARADPGALTFVATLVAAALAMNGAFHWLLASGRAVPFWVPLGVGIFDAAAITGAIAVFDGFDNGGYVLYYPALMGFAAFFRGRVGLTYCLGIMAAYSILSLTAYQHFDPALATDWHDLGLRLLTMMAVVLMAYLLVRVERQRRLRAVAAEADRQHEVLALEEQSRERERRAERERLRLLREIHDGVSQGVFVLTLGLEDAAHQLSLESGDAKLRERINALVRLSKGTLLEARGLLFDLGPALERAGDLEAIVRHEAEEFSAVTGIPVSITCSGGPFELSAPALEEVYRVVRELLANIYRHAGANAVRIALFERGTEITLTISDDGAGFDVDAAGGRGYGLGTMRERALAIGATLHVQSAPGAGSCITLTIPHPAEREGELAHNGPHPSR